MSQLLIIMLCFMVIKNNRYIYYRSRTLPDKKPWQSFVNKIVCMHVCACMRACVVCMCISNLQHLECLETATLPDILSLSVSLTKEKQTNTWTHMKNGKKKTSSSCVKQTWRYMHAQCFWTGFLITSVSPIVWNPNTKHQTAIFTFQQHSWICLRH